MRERELAIVACIAYQAAAPLHPLMYIKWHKPSCSQPRPRAHYRQRGHALYSTAYGLSLERMGAARSLAESGCILGLVAAENAVS